jgi:Mg2+ and Co2+ transporter CorA
MLRIWPAVIVLVCASLLLADDAAPSVAGNRNEVGERFEQLRQGLMNDLTNHLITSDQFNAEITKLDQLKNQEHADASQNNNALSNDQRRTYNDLLSQIQREIEQMETATPQSGNATAIVPVAVPLQNAEGHSAGKSARARLYERFQELRAELTNDLNNHLVTPDQFNTEIARLNQLKIQEHADAAQDLLKDQQTLYSEQLRQIQTDIDQMVEKNSAPAPAQ